MELYEFHLLFLFVREVRITIRMAVADDVRSDFLGQIGRKIASLIVASFCQTLASYAAAAYISFAVL